jgi:hypothetical protein
VRLPEYPSSPAPPPRYDAGITATAHKKSIWKFRRLFSRRSWEILGLVNEQLHKLGNLERQNDAEHPLDQSDGGFYGCHILVTATDGRDKPI